jgi:hypothetical protein
MRTGRLIGTWKVLQILDPKRTVSCIQMNLPVPSEVFEYFAADPEGPMWNVSRAMEAAPKLWYAA